MPIVQGPRRVELEHAGFGAPRGRPLRDQLGRKLEVVVLGTHAESVHARPGLWQVARVLRPLVTRAGRLSPLLLALGLLAPGQSLAGSPAATQTEGEAKASSEPQASQLAADLDLVLDGRGRVYLDARARLLTTPEATRDAVLARLDALDAREKALRPPGEDGSPPDEAALAEIERARGRLVGLLSELVDPADAPRFAAQLRSALLSEQPQDPWRPLLISLGAAAVPDLAKLVADRELPMHERKSLLEELVELTPGEQLEALVRQLGQGNRELERALRRALVRRARADAGDETRLRAQLDARWRDESVDAGARAACLLVLHQVSFGQDPELDAAFSELAADRKAPFELRAAALIALEGGHGETARIEGVASFNLAAERRSEQRSELLAWLALQALDINRARPLVDSHRLVDSRAPRLAEFAWRARTLPAQGGWLAQALESPWPEIRIAAINRVAEGAEPSCSREQTRALAERAGPQSLGGDDSTAVASVAARALGRCGASEALEKLLDETGISFEQRAVVARALILGDPARGSKIVAARLRPDLPPQLAERYASELARSPSPGEAEFEALCRTEAAVPTATSSARRSRRILFPERGCP